MDWKRKLELTCGLITGVLGICVTLEGLRVERLTGEMLGNPPDMFTSFLVSMALYTLPGCLAAVGAYLHAARGLFLGWMLLTVPSMLLTTMFFLLLVALAWSAWILLSWLIVLLTGSAIFTLLVSFFVLFPPRSETISLYRGTACRLICGHFGSTCFEINGVLFSKRG